jgi:hypothetical protein
MAKPAIPSGDSPQTPQGAKPVAKRKWFKRPLFWAAGGGALVFALIFLVLLGPTLAGFWPIRAIVEHIASNQVKGSVRIDSYSVGWFGSTSVRGAKVFDDKGQLILTADLDSPISLLDGLRGKFDLGKSVGTITINHFDCYADGRTTLDTLLATSSTPVEKGPAAKSAPAATGAAAPIPDVKGDFVLNVSGQVYQPGVAKPLIIVPGTKVSISIPDINGKITDNGQLILTGPDGSTGTISLAGDATAVKNNLLNLDGLKAQQKVTISGISVPGLMDLVDAAVPGLGYRVGSGVQSGTLALTADGMNHVQVAGNFRTDNLKVGGGAIKGTDELKLDRITVPINATIGPAADGKPFVDADVQVLLNEGKLGSVKLTAKGSRDAFMAPIAATPAGAGAATVELTASLPQIGKVAPMLRETLGPQGDISDGTLTTTTTIALSNGAAAVKSLTLFVVDQPAAKTAERISVDARTTQALGAAGADVPMTVTFGVNGWIYDKTATPPATYLTKLATNVEAHLIRGGASDPFLTEARAFTLNVRGGSSDAPDLNIEATADVNLANLSAPKWRLAKFQVPDLARTVNQYAFLMPALQQQGIKVESGVISAQAAGSYDGKTLTLTEPAQFSAQNLTIDKHPFGTIPKYLLNQEQIRGVAQGSLSIGTSVAAVFDQLSLNSSSGLFSVTKAKDQTFSVHFDPKSGISGGGQVTLAADAKRLIDMVNALAGAAPGPTDPQMTSGTLTATLAVQQAHGSGTKLSINGQLGNLTVMKGNQAVVTNQALQLAANLATPADGSTLSGDLKLDGALAKVSMDGLDVQLSDASGRAVSSIDMLRGVHVNAQVPDVGKVMTILNAAEPKATAWKQEVLANMYASADAGAPAAPVAASAPLDVSGGAATIDMQISRDVKAHTTSATGNARLAGVALTRGSQQYAFGQGKDIAVKFGAAVDATSGDTAMQINRIAITSLSGDLGGLATLSMPTPLTIEHPMNGPKASGFVQLDGAIGPARPLLIVVAGQDLPATGNYSLHENLSSHGNDIDAKGGVDVTNLQVYQDGKAVAGEKHLSLNNSLSADLTKHDLAVEGLSVVFAGSKAANVNMTGSIHDWAVSRKLDLSADVGYDLAKLMPIVQPLLSDSTRQMLAGATIAGQYQSHWVIGGAYPAEDSAHKPLAFGQAIQQVTAFGDVSVGTIVLPTYDTTITNFKLPLTLDGGVAKIVYAGKPDGQNLPQAATFNEGLLDLGGLQVDLRGAEPRFTSPPNKHIVIHSRINRALANTLGKYAGSIFANAQNARGFVDVTFVKADGVALGNSLTTANSGSAQVVFSVHQLDLVNPMGHDLVTKVLGKLGYSAPGFDPNRADAFVGQIENSTVDLNNGLCTPSIAMQLVDPNMTEDAALEAIQRKVPIDLLAMNFSVKGWVRLSDMQQHLDVRLPPQLIVRFCVAQLQPVGNLLLVAFPEGIPVVFGGTASSPTLEVGDIGKAFVQAQGTQLQKGGNAIGNGVKDGVNNIGHFLGNIGKQGNGN